MSNFNSSFLNFLWCTFKSLFIYFICGYAESSLLLELFCRCSARGYSLSSGVWASHCSGPSGCGAQALECAGFSSCGHTLGCSVACGVFPDRGLNQCLLL